MASRRRVRRVNARIAGGLNSIYAFMSCEHEARQDSNMECRCRLCSTGADGCECYDKPYAKQCEGCRDYHDIGEALGWIGAVIDRYQESTHAPQG